jgi:hypothetical protein
MPFKIDKTKIGTLGDDMANGCLGQPDEVIFPVQPVHERVVEDSGQ